MNEYIRAQITNLLVMTKTFEQSCKMAAMKEDGKVDEDESKVLKKISKVTKRYQKELEKIRG